MTILECNGHGFNSLTVYFMLKCKVSLKSTYECPPGCRAGESLAFTCVCLCVFYLKPGTQEITATFTPFLWSHFWLQHQPYRWMNEGKKTPPWGLTQTPGKRPRQSYHVLTKIPATSVCLCLCVSVRMHMWYIRMHVCMCMYVHIR